MTEKQLLSEYLWQQQQPIADDMIVDVEPQNFIKMPEGKPDGAIYCTTRFTKEG